MTQAQRTSTGITARGPLRAGWRLGAGAGVLGVEGAAGYLHPWLGAAFAAIDILMPLGIALVLLAAILRGSDQTCERVFRLLRWLSNCPEPPAPGTTTPKG